MVFATWSAQRTASSTKSIPFSQRETVIIQLLLLILLLRRIRLPRSSITSRDCVGWLSVDRFPNSICCNSARRIAYFIFRYVNGFPI